jgi:hypothetical protein
MKGFITSPAEITVRSSIQVFTAKSNYPKPEGFGTGFILSYKERIFFVSVSHVTDRLNLTTYLESNLPLDEQGPIIHPIGGICYWDIFKVDSPDKIKSIEDFEAILQNAERLDISFAEIKNQIELLQPELDFGAFKVNSGRKFMVTFEKSCVPNKDEEYAFFGRIKHEYEGDVLKMENTFKDSLKYHRDIKFGEHRFNMFLSPKRITNKEDYEGCSGAPIFDSLGNIVSIACAIKVNSNIIYGFPIEECRKLLDYSIDIGMI